MINAGSFIRKCNNKLALHFGAGNIGRGFICPELKKSNYDVVFVDVNEDLTLSFTHTDSMCIVNNSYEFIGTAFGPN